MGYTEAKLAEYPIQDEQELLIEFSAQFMARLEYKATAHAGISWEAWLDGDPCGGHDRLEPFRESARRLSGMGMLTWPEATTDPSVSWTIEGPGRSRGPGRAPELDWILTFGRATAKAVTYSRSLTLTGVPHRLSWSSFSDGRG